MVGHCTKCKKSFRYQDRGRKRAICDACIQANLHRHMALRRDSQKRLTGEEGARKLESDGIALMDRISIAKIQGVSRARIEQIERNALAKIRNHPDAKRLFKFWKDEGCPTAPAQADPSEKLLDWHLSLAELWSIYEEMFMRGCRDEALECRAEITEFYKTLRKAILEFRPQEMQWLRNITH